MDTKGYFISSTFAGESLSIKEALATIEKLNNKNLNTLWVNGAYFQKEFNKIDKRIQLVGIPTRATWKGEETIKAKFWQEMYKSGYLFGKAWFITLAHTRAILDKTLNDAREVLRGIDKVKLVGKMPQEVFKRF
jgi:glutamate-1-semialdehyde aminotransferase